MPEPIESGSERRACVRYRCEQPSSRVFIADSYKTVSASILDVSQTGLGLSLSQPLPAGTRLTAELEGPIPMELVADIVNSIPQPDGTWRCGCLLVHKLSEGEVRLLVKCLEPRASS